MKERCSSAALVAAIRFGNIDLINTLDARGVQLNRTVELTDAITAATRRGDIRVLRLLLGDDSRHRATIVKSLGVSPCNAIFQGQNEITEMRLAAGAAVNGGNSLTKDPPLLMAIRPKDAHLAQTLLAAGAAVNDIDG